MNTSRIIVIVLALCAGAAAFFLMMGNDPQEVVQIVEKVEEKTTRVLVADADFVRGDRLAAEKVKWIDWPEKALSPYYLTEGAIEIADLENAVARSSMVAGEPVIETKIVRADSAGMMAAVLQPGMRAVTMRIAAETGSGGFILPGDRVDVYYTEPDDSNETQFMLLLENVKILAIDAYYNDEEPAAHLPGGTATIELSPSDAEFFTVANNSKGQITLALRSVFESDQVVEKKQRTDVEVIRYGRS